MTDRYTETDRLVDELRAVLAPLLDAQPEYIGGMVGDGGYQCRFCLGTAVDVLDVRHAEGCAFLRRDELLGRPG